MMMMVYAATDYRMTVTTTNKAPWKAISGLIPCFLPFTRLHLVDVMALNFGKTFGLMTPGCVIGTPYFNLPNYQDSLICLIASTSPSGISWNLNLCCPLREVEIPEMASILDLLRSFTLSQDSPDHRVWLGHRFDSFTVKSFFHIVNNDQTLSSFPTGAV